MYSFLPDTSKHFLFFIFLNHPSAFFGFILKAHCQRIIEPFRLEGILEVSSPGSTLSSDQVAPENLQWQWDCTSLTVSWDSLLFSIFLVWTSLVSSYACYLLSSCHIPSWRDQLYLFNDPVCTEGCCQVPHQAVCAPSRTNSPFPDSPPRANNLAPTIFLVSAKLPQTSSSSMSLLYCEGQNWMQ